MSLIPSFAKRVGTQGRPLLSLMSSVASPECLPFHTNSAILLQEPRHRRYLKSHCLVRLSSSTSSSSPEETKKYIQSIIGENKVTIFSKTYCPYCDKTKKLFRTVGEDAMILELDIRRDGNTIQEELVRMTGQGTVPNVFVNGRHVGGNDKCHALAKSGELDEMLKI